jgi:hypothetical protein
MRDYITLGPTPAEEECAQIGDELYDHKARAECRRFIKLLRETFCEEPSGAYLQAKGFPHDFGTYWEVVCYFNPDVPGSIEYALKCEREAPTEWGSEEDATDLCPECGDPLEYGNAVQLISFAQGDGFRCESCKLIFARDLTVLANYTGWEDSE